MIDGVPLYETKREALLWAKQYGLTGNHAHFFNGIRGYMGGRSHVEITTALQSGPKVTLSAIETGSSNFITDDKLVKLYQERDQQQTLNQVNVAEEQLVVTPIVVTPTVAPIVTTTTTAAPTSTSGGSSGGY
tara:strand:- start:934 stop:1329 length:396 start_codon:yes stop_codon:yes gene_type:complete